MIVDVEVEAPSEPLGKADGAASQLLSCWRRPTRTHPDAQRTLPAEDFFDEDAPHCGERIGALGEEKPKLERDRKHPLPQSNIGQHPVYQASRRIGHAPCVAAGTDAALLAGEGDEQHVSAILTACTSKPVGVNTTRGVRLEFLLYVFGQPAAKRAFDASRNDGRCS